MIDSSLSFWKQARAARIPSSSLGQLAWLRDRSDLLVIEEADQTWVFWEDPWEPVIDSLLTIAGICFFEPWGDRWLPLGKRVPVSLSPPTSRGRPLGAILVPQPLVGTRPPDAPVPPLPWKMVPGGKPQSATAMKCALADLATWAQGVPDCLIEVLEGALCGGEVLIRGARLPVILSGTRYFGQRVWLPLGYRGEPDLPEDGLIALAGKGLGGILVCGESGQEWIPEGAFASLSRAGIQMAWRASSARSPEP